MEYKIIELKPPLKKIQEQLDEATKQGFSIIKIIPGTTFLRRGLIFLERESEIKGK